MGDFIFMLRFLFFACCALIMNNNQVFADGAGIQPWEENRWYWSYNQKPTLLLGGSNDDNLFQWPPEALRIHLDLISSAGGNYVRNVMSDRKTPSSDHGLRNFESFEVYPFHRRTDGKYDLNKWNDEYWKRFERFLKETFERSIIVQLEIWDRFDYTDYRDAGHWLRHPYNPKNNVNYNQADSGLAEHYPDHPARNLQPFFFTTPKQKNNSTVLYYQNRFVDKLLEHSLNYNHVLYCIDNETSGEEAWSRYWATYIKTRAKELHKEVFVTEMWDDWDIKSEMHRRTFDHPNLFDFVDISQNNHNSSDSHWDNIMAVKEYLLPHPRPINAIKIYGGADNKYGSEQDAVERFWRQLLAGVAAIRFHRPAGLGAGEKALNCIRAARKLESKVPLWSLTPANELIFNRAPNSGFLAAEGMSRFAFYSPGGKPMILNVPKLKTAKVHWINIDTGEWGKEQDYRSGQPLILRPPEKGNWTAAILVGKR